MNITSLVHLSLLANIMAFIMAACVSPIFWLHVGLGYLPVLVSRLLSGFQIFSA